jgi:mono/diheme cytochrome c family protein
MPEPSAERRIRNRRSAVLGGILLVGGAWLAPARAAQASEPRVTPASGPSLIARLKTGVDWTAFGRAGESQAVEPAAPAQRAPGEWIEQGFRLTGADLFRLDCRGCHGPDGKGSRSGIPPLLGALDKPAEPTTGEAGGEIRVRHRLVDGGRIMPTFGHLQGAEVDLVIGHLRALTAPTKEPTATVNQSAMHVGEHIVKATCQICHDAVPGPWRQPADQLTVIPLSAMTDKLSVQEFVRKVRAGSPQTGSPHGRMPRFDYLTPEELEAAYLYLTAYPPQEEKR